MKDVFKILLNLYKIKSRNAKKDIVANQKNNQILKDIFKFAMDDYNIYGVAESSFKTILKKKEFFYKPEELETLFEEEYTYSLPKWIEFKDVLIPYLIETQSCGKEVLKRLERFFVDLNPVEKYWYYRIIIKNMNLGIGPTLINRALGELLIKQYTPMLADSGIEKFAKWKFKNNKKIFYTDTKINGLRLSIFIYKNKDVIIKTRSGRRFLELESFIMKNSMPDFYKRAFMNHESDDIVVIDCELQHVDKTWESSIGIINLKDPKIYENGEPLFYLHCFDMVNNEPFLPKNYGKEIETLPLSKRRNNLETFIRTKNDNDVDKLFILTDNQIIEDDLSKVETLAKDYISKGFEGAVVKHPDSAYVCGRKQHWLKIKDIKTYDGKIIDILPGELSGKNHNTCGKIIVEVEIDGKLLQGTCGSGFKDVDRKLLWDNKEIMIGKTCEFTILGKTVTNNFQSGIFKGIRVDK